MCAKKASATQRQTIVYQGNSLTEAHYNMSELQKDVLYMLQGMIKSTDSSNKLYTLRVVDIAHLRGTDDLYANLKSIIHQMVDIKFQIITGNTIISIAPFPTATYQAGSGTITIRVNPDIRPLLTGLTGNYTGFGQANAMRLRGKHAKRLYEMCSQWKTAGGFKITVAALKRRLQLITITETGSEELEEYPNYNMFYRRVLLPSLDAINEYTDLNVSLKTKKTGKKITDLLFSIKINLPLELYPSLPEPPVERNYTGDPVLGLLKQQLIDNYRLREDQADLVLGRYGHDPQSIYKKLHEIQKANAHKPIANWGAYTAKAFGIL